MEKAIISFLKGGSALIYVLIFCLILAMPVIFIYQAFMPPVFTFDSVSVTEELTEDVYLKEQGIDTVGWKKAEFSLFCSSGTFSPYSYEITKFAAEKNGILENAENYRIVLDEPIFCTKDIEDNFTISLYIKSDSADLSELAKTITFTASDYEKSFGEFKLKFEDGKAQFFKK